MPPVTIPARVTVLRVRRGVLDVAKVHRLWRWLYKRKPRLDFEGWKLRRIVGALEKAAQGKRAEWGMPVQSSDLFRHLRPYDIEGYLEKHDYIADGCFHLSLAIWRTPAELHHLYHTLLHLQEQEMLEDVWQEIAKAVVMFELTPGCTDYFFLTLLEEESG